ncbi:OMEGA-6 FATTY ACID DESATURASE CHLOROPLASTIC [Salix koriyanagi]|uniref:OMEGA-6 FATTY ACID DESATURASE CHLOROPLASTIC n=1 Tax=Salix koriyanagi TaxID=2511006 RepID=A0A9Q0WU95_9ROSI|nr:OMEGA-6 FATTY ACID DESATURASE CHLOROPLASTIC [Salix koriyanagi]
MIFGFLVARFGGWVLGIVMFGFWIFGKNMICDVVPVSVPVIEKEDKERESVKGIDEHEGELFNPNAPPPFKLADIRAAIPNHCWVKNPWRSMSYVVRDVVVVFGLAIAAAHFNNGLFGLFTGLLRDHVLGSLCSWP